MSVFFGPKVSASTLPLVQGQWIVYVSRKTVEDEKECAAYFLSAVASERQGETVYDYGTVTIPMSTGIISVRSENYATNYTLEEARRKLRDKVNKGYIEISTWHPMSPVGATMKRNLEHDIELYIEACRVASHNIYNIPETAASIKLSDDIVAARKPFSNYPGDDFYDSVNTAWNKIIPAIRRGDQNVIDLFKMDRQRYVRGIEKMMSMYLGQVPYKNAIKHLVVDFFNAL
jgi:hypothetical protein